MKKQIISISVCTVLLGVTGCASVGNASVSNESQQSVAQKVTTGKTTKNEVRAMYGEPTSTSSGSGGTESWTYSYSDTKGDPKKFIPLVGIFIADSDKLKVRVLEFTFNKNGTVAAYNFTNQNTEIKMFGNN